MRTPHFPPSSSFSSSSAARLRFVACVIAILAPFAAAGTQEFVDVLRVKKQEPSSLNELSVDNDNQPAEPDLKMSPQAVVHGAVVVDALAADASSPEVVTKELQIPSPYLIDVENNSRRTRDPISKQDHPQKPLPVDTSAEFTRGGNVNNLQPGSVSGIQSAGTTAVLDESKELSDMTIGELLMGINGQNGIRVLPMSSLNRIIASNGQASEDNRSGSSNVKGEQRLPRHPQDSNPTPTPPSKTPTTRRPRRRRPTKTPDVLRTSLSDLLYAKGQLFGTFLGGMIDFGRIAMDAFKRNRDKNDNSQHSYA